MPKMRIEEKTDTSEAQPHGISEVEKPQRNDIKIYRHRPHKYNTRSRTKRVNHVTTFKTALNMF